MKVIAYPRYSLLGASSRLRMAQYFPHLARAGIEVETRPLLGDRYIATLYARGRRDPMELLTGYARRARHLLRRDSAHLLWIEKELLPGLPATLERVLAGPCPFVVDYDDAVFHNYDRHPHPILRRLMGRKIDRVMRAARLVVAGNEYLAERARQAGARDVRILPTVIDWERYTTPAPPRPEGPFVIGWMGSPVSARYLKTIAPALAEVCRDGRARVVTVGAGRDFNLPGVPLENRDWTESLESEQLQSFDAGIMPLENTPWERGKCGYKLIQYMAVGRPVVASPVGVNAHIVEEGVNGFLAADGGAWVRALSRLRDQPALCAQLGRAGRDRVRREYTLQVTAPRLAAWLQEVADMP